MDVYIAKTICGYIMTYIIPNLNRQYYCNIIAIGVKTIAISESELNSTDRKGGRVFKHWVS